MKEHSTIERGKTQRALSERFAKAYKRISFKMRSAARAAFCEVHGITYQTFRHKVAGTGPVTEMECEWLEKYDPYTQSIAA